MSSDFWLEVEIQIKWNKLCPDINGIVQLVMCCLRQNTVCLSLVGWLFSPDITVLCQLQQFIRVTKYYD